LRVGLFAASFGVLASEPVRYSTRSGDGHLWLIAFGISVLFNLGLLVLAGLMFLRTPASTTIVDVSVPFAEEPPATIYVEVEGPNDSAVTTKMLDPQFARTSDDQVATPEQPTPFFGERDTRATSDAVPDAAAPALPSQAGIEPKPGQIETTESHYQDGSLKTSPPSTEVAHTTPEVLPNPPPQPVETQKSPVDAAANDVSSLPPPREKLMEGPNPVDVKVPRETGKQDELKHTPTAAQASVTPPQQKAVEQKTPERTPDTKAFKGYQRKTAMVGSITRNGRSALDVENTALGRYEAVISRAVELEWQRNCVRHRDYITPGFLTVRFFVESSGKVRSVQFVGDMETGEIQKGFTLNSIRDAEIPSMPNDLKKEFDGEPLELMFRFYF
jgi:hypothetical protein